MSAVLLDLLAISSAYGAASLAYFGAVDADLVGRPLAALIPIYFLFGLAIQTYPVPILLDGYRSVWRAGTALAWASLLLFLIFFFLKISEEFSRALLGLGSLFSISFLAVVRMWGAHTAARTLGPNPFASLSLYDGIAAAESQEQGSIDVSEIGLEPEPENPEMLNLLGRLAFGMDRVIVYCVPEKREKWAFMLKALDVRTEIVTPELSNLNPLAIGWRSGETSLILGSGQLSFSQRVLKRSFDLMVTLALMPFLLPVLVIVGILVKLDSPGPALFKQDRIGLGNRKFKILKFRTMRIDMQDDKAQTLTQRGDPRITRLGGLLRKTSLDELPQFLNVLLGDMSIVGPRPHAEAARAGGALYWEVDRTYWHRHVVKPGITGLAQIRGHRGNTVEERDLRDRLDSDLEYVSDWSLATDLIITLRTIGVIVHKNAF